MNIPKGFTALKHGQRLRRSDKVLINGQWRRAARYGHTVMPEQKQGLTYIRKVKKDGAAELIRLNEQEQLRKAGL